MKSLFDKLILTDDNAGVFDGEWRGGGAKIDKISPIDGRRIASVRTASEDDYNKAITRAQEAFSKWRVTPGPVRGETVRRLGNALRELKHELGQLVTLETGKIIAEGEGEVQEMIDICDLAVGQSRMLYGLTIQSERSSHRLMEQWHPLGVIAVITAFNFPVAVWSWNAALAAVCGDATVWKASEKTPLTAVAVTKIAERVCRDTGADPAIFTLLIGDRKTVGQKLTDDPRIPLVSATGSTNMGFNVAKAVNGRLGRTILELGGNNALIVAPSADLDMATQSIFFGAVGTAGQRCTSTRRVIMHESVAPKVQDRLLAAYKSLTIGNSAIASHCTDEFLGFAHVVGENGRGQPLRHVIVARDRLIEIAIRHQVKQRSKCFVLHDLEIGFCGREARLHVTIAGDGEALPAIEDLATFIFQSLDRMLDKIDRVLIDERSHHCFVIERIADRQRFVCSQEFILNLWRN